MSLSIGIVGLPNVGKSTLFNALLRQAKAEVANYPFTTIKPNEGIVEVPDSRLEQIAKKIGLSKKIPATIKFVDIAGLVKGAHKGEGLGNQFLAHIRECDVILEVIRYFEDEKIAGVVDPESDLETIKTELVLKDLETVEKALKKTEGEKKAILLKIKSNLLEEKQISEVDLSEKEKKLILEFQFLTQKPILYVANLSEIQIQNPLPALPENFIPLSAKTEWELSELSQKEAQEYLESLGMKESGVTKIIKEGYKLLGLITFYTLIPLKQVQAWSIPKATKAPQAAGKIHSDFEKEFISAECIFWKDLLEIGSWEKTKEIGKIRIEGKNYFVQDGDVIHFKYA